MNFPEKRDFIFDQLKRRVGIAVEPDGFQSDAKPEDIFEAYADAGNLSEFADLQDKIETYSRATPQNFQEARNKLDEVKAILSKFAEHLAKNAEIGNVDLTKVAPEIFDKQARLFEQRNKAKLTVVSPSHFI